MERGAKKIAAYFTRKAEVELQIESKKAIPILIVK
jgi:hypothetical protein